MVATPPRMQRWLLLGPQGLVSILIGAVAAVAACDKLSPREHTTPYGDPKGFGPRWPMPDPDAQVSQSFLPDAGAADAAAAESASCSELPSADQTFSKANLLHSFARCAAVNFCEFTGLAKQLAAAADAYFHEASSTNLDALKGAWYFAMQRWQVAELLRYGPSAPKMEQGGGGMREHIYAFPLFNRCGVDELIADQSTSAGLDHVADNAKGLAALEYLLFYTGSDNGCASFHRLNARREWAKLSSDEINERKLALIAALAQDLYQHAREVSDAWEGGDGSFAEELASAGRGSSVFTAEQAGLNAVSNALFYLDKEVKDWKVARPAYLFPEECTQNCAALAESLYARVGADNVRANLRGARLLLQGCAPNFEGLGFDDWLTAVDSSTGRELLAALDAAEAGFSDFALDQEIERSASSVDEKRRLLKAITDILKSDFLMDLDLAVSMTAEGDND